MSSNDNKDPGEDQGENQGDDSHQVEQLESERETGGGVVRHVRISAVDNVSYRGMPRNISMSRDYSTDVWRSSRLSTLIYPETRKSFSEKFIRSSDEHKNTASDVFGPIFHQFRRSTEYDEQMIEEKKRARSSDSSTSKGQSLFERKKLFEDKMDRISSSSNRERGFTEKFKPSDERARSTVDFEEQIAIGKDVTYNDVMGRIWILVICCILWSITLALFIIRFYTLRNQPIIKVSDYKHPTRLASKFSPEYD